MRWAEPGGSDPLSCVVICVEAGLRTVSELLLADPVLTNFRSALDKLYGENLERVVLFGSRARGDAGDESDYDIAVFLRHFTDRWREINRLAALETDFLIQTGAFIHAMPYRAGSYLERTPLMHEIRREGIDL